MLRIREATKAFGAITVVDRVNLDVHKGEVHALLGANGAGKSTLINILGGRFPDASGRFTLNDRDIRLSSPSAAIREGIVIVHQEAELVPHLSVAENVFLGHERTSERAGLLRPIGRDGLFARARRLLDAFALEIPATATVFSLPPAARQLVQIARALSHDAEVVIFDEPTARLGPNERAVLFSIFERLRQDGRMLIFVTHYLDEVIQVADRATVMRDGRRVDTVAVADTSVAALSRMMVGDDVVPRKRASVAARGKVSIAVRHGQLPGFADLSLEVARGEIVGLLGHPGSGRREVTRGIVELLRRSQNGRVGFVPEDRRAEGLFPFLSVAENISLGILSGRPLLSVRKIAAEKAVAGETIRQLSLKCSGPGQPVSELSGGNQQKAVFGRATVLHPEVYVIECPTVGVDVKAASEIHRQIFELADKGASIVLATDDLDEALFLADRLLVMFRSRISAELAASEATRPALIAAMGAMQGGAHA